MPSIKYANLTTYYSTICALYMVQYNTVFPSVGDYCKSITHMYVQNSHLWESTYIYLHIYTYVQYSHLWETTYCISHILYVCTIYSSSTYFALHLRLTYNTVQYMLHPHTSNPHTLPYANQPFFYTLNHLAITKFQDHIHTHLGHSPTP